MAGRKFTAKKCHHMITKSVPKIQRERQTLEHPIIIVYAFAKLIVKKLTRMSELEILCQDLASPDFIKVFNKVGQNIDFTRKERGRQRERS